MHSFEVTLSTNDDARAAAESGAAQGAVFWALEQQAGRGRRGRVWASPPGNLYCSVVLRPTVHPKNYGHYSFIAALAINDTIRDILCHKSDADDPSPPALEAGGEGKDRSRHSHNSSNGVRWAFPQVALKWPNDVLVNGKKISGILLESGDGFLIVGIGINVLHMPENPLYPVTSLSAEQANPPPLETILNRLLQSLGHWCHAYDTAGFAPIREGWLSRARRGDMRVRLPDGDIHGRFADLDPDGNLRLLLPTGELQIVHTGDVFFSGSDCAF